MAVAIEPQWTLGNRLWKARDEAHLDQEDLARQLKVSRQLIGKWEKDRSEPSITQARRLAEITGVKLSWLVGDVTVGLLPCDLHGEVDCHECLPSMMAMSYAAAS